MATRRKPISRRLRIIELRSWISFIKLLNFRRPGKAKRIPDEQKIEVRELLHPGDILLEDDSAYPLWQLANRVVGSSWSHAAFYVGDGLVIDSGSKSVVAEVSLDEFLETSDIAIFRPAYDHPEDVDSALAFLRTKIGCRFNSSFKRESCDAFYCTQLVAGALAQLRCPVHLPRKQWMFLDLILPSAVESSNHFSLVWTNRKPLLKLLWEKLPKVRLRSAITLTSLRSFVLQIRSSNR